MWNLLNQRLPNRIVPNPSSFWQSSFSGLGWEIGEYIADHYIDWLWDEVIFTSSDVCG